MVQNLEYLVIDLSGANAAQEQQAVLNEVGKNGWELVAVTPNSGLDGSGRISRQMAYLKRERTSGV